MCSSRALSRTGDAELVQQGTGVERLVAQPARDLLARRSRSLEEEAAQPLARLGSPPPVLTRIAEQRLAQLRRADPGAEVVGRVEARVHVREIVLAWIADAGRIGQALGVAVSGSPVLAEAAP